MLYAYPMYVPDSDANFLPLPVIHRRSRTVITGRNNHLPTLSLYPRSYIEDHRLVNHESS